MEITEKTAGSESNLDGKLYSLQLLDGPQKMQSNGNGELKKNKAYELLIEFLFQEIQQEYETVVSRFNQLRQTLDTLTLSALERIGSDLRKYVNVIEDKLQMFENELTFMMAEELETEDGPKEESQVNFPIDKTSKIAEELDNKEVSQVNSTTDNANMCIIVPPHPQSQQVYDEFFQKLTLKMTRNLLAKHLKGKMFAIDIKLPYFKDTFSDKILLNKKEYQCKVKFDMTTKAFRCWFRIDRPEDEVDEGWVAPIDGLVMCVRDKLNDIVLDFNILGYTYYNSCLVVDHFVIMQEVWSKVQPQFSPDSYELIFFGHRNKEGSQVNSTMNKINAMQVPPHPQSQQVYDEFFHKIPLRETRNILAKHLKGQHFAIDINLSNFKDTFSDKILLNKKEYQCKVKFDMSTEAFHCWFRIDRPEDEVGDGWVAPIDGLVMCVRDKLTDIVLDCHILGYTYYNSCLVVDHFHIIQEVWSKVQPQFSPDNYELIFFGHHNKEGSHVNSNMDKINANISIIVPPHPQSKQFYDEFFRNIPLRETRNILAKHLKGKLFAIDINLPNFKDIFNDKILLNKKEYQIEVWFDMTTEAFRCWFRINRPEDEAGDEWVAPIDGLVMCVRDKLTDIVLDCHILGYTYHNSCLVVDHFHIMQEVWSKVQPQFSLERYELIFLAHCSKSMKDDKN